MTRLNGRADLHIHTNVSDGVNSVQEVLDYVEQYMPLDAIAITDHDRIEASLWAYEHRHQYSFGIVPGLEVTSHDGHVLALWVTQMIPAGLSLAETAAAIHEAGGIAILAHPLEPTIAPHTFLRYLREPGVLSTANIDAVEVWNAGAITPGCNWLAQRVYANVAIPKVGNSDAHMLASIGSGVTRFAGRTTEDLRRAITTGQTAAEGNTWPITTYWKLLKTGVLNRRSESSEMKSPFAPQTPM
jgi:predicted metal-dependent phosphoesterase TrpH